MAVHHAAGRDAALRVDVVDGLLRQAHIAGKAHVPALQLAGVRHDEVAGCKVGHVFVHIKAAGKVDGHRQQHDRQRKREHRHRRFALAAAQVGPGHRERGHAAGLAGFGAPLPAALGIAHGFHRRDFARHAPRPPAGQQHRAQRKQSGGGKDPRADRGDGPHAVEPRRDHRRQLPAQQPAEREPGGDAGGGQRQRLQADDAPQLPGRRADGLEQAVEPDIPGHRDLEHVVDDEVPGKHDEQRHRGDGDRRHGVEVFRKLRPGVAPVDAGGDVVVPGGLALVAVVGQDLLDIPLNVPRPAFEHHVKVPATGHAVGRGFGVHPHLGKDGVHPALGDQHMVGHNGFVVLPPAAERKGLGGLVPVYRKGKGELRAKFRLDAQQFQHVGVGGGFVGALLRQAALHRVAVHPVGFVFVAPADFHMGFGKGHVPGHPQKAPHPPLVHEGVAAQLLGLLRGDVFEPAVGKPARLAEVVLLEPLVDGKRKGEQRGEQQRRQRDGRDGDQVAGAAGQQRFPGQAADAGAIFDVHAFAPLTV